MRRILACLAFGVFLAGAIWLPPLGLAQQASEAPAQASGKSEPGRLGVELRDLADRSVKALGLTQAHAVLVAFTAAGGPAELAGVRPGDVIVELEGAAVGVAQLSLFDSRFRNFRGARD